MSAALEDDEAEPERALSEEEIAALRKLIAQRMRGEFLDMEQSNAQIEEMIAAKRKQYGL